MQFGIAPLTSAAVYDGGVTAWERLTALDASFLGLEDERTPMHVGAVVICDAGPLETEDGGIDFDKLCRFFESTLAIKERYRQRVEWIPGLGHPVWVDDEHFNIFYHVRHVALPRPGDERQLKRLAGRVFSQRLDRTRPLWEAWVVEGLSEHRFALVVKIHHAMIDGVAGVDLMTSLFRGTPDDSIAKVTIPEPRPRPNRREMLSAELDHRAKGSREILDKIGDVIRDPKGWWEGARDTAEGIASTIISGLAPASKSPLNPKRIGPNRRFDFARFDLAKVKEVKSALGGKLNDVVLATACGAVTRFLDRRGVDLAELVDFRALVPVSVRKTSERGAGGNKVGMMLANLPVQERDVERRFQLICEMMNYLKTQSHQVESTTALEELADKTAAGLVRSMARIAGRQRAYNLVVTNVPGPPFPMYLLGGRIRELYPLVPLISTQALGLALFSYDGSLFWGLNADWQEMPDLHEFAEDLEASFAELAELALGPAETAPAKSSANSQSEPRVGVSMPPTAQRRKTE